MYTQNGVSSSSTFVAGSNAQTLNTPKVRNIEDIVAEIGAELTEAHNSACNLADKIGGSEPEGKGEQVPTPNSLQSRLEAILGGLRHTNYHLNRSHRALNG